MDELKFIIRRDSRDVHDHLLENMDFRAQFYDGSLEKITNASSFRVKTSPAA